MLVLGVGAGCGAGAGCRELAVGVVETGYRCWVPVLVPVLERSLSIGAVGHLHSSGSVLADGCVKGCTVCAHTFVRTKLYAQRQALNQPLFQHATDSIVVLDTAWPWASETYGLCCLCAYFCAHRLVRTRSYTVLSFYRSLLQACYNVNSGAGYCLALGQ